MMKLFILLALMLLLTSCKDAAHKSEAEATPSRRVNQSIPVAAFPAFRTMTLTKSKVGVLMRTYTHTLSTSCIAEGVYSYRNADQAYVEIQTFLNEHEWQAVNLSRKTGKARSLWLAGHMEGDHTVVNRMIGEWWTNPDRTGEISLCIFGDFTSPEKQRVNISQSDKVGD